ncbi:MAG: FAD-dependent oxidoreductase [Salinarimonas sp.]|nr:FAD-dependent oxidoreductase [Salinarimonas sp.]
MADIPATDAKTQAAQAAPPDPAGAAKKREIRTDLCVIGAGSGGLSVAAIAASFGVPVVLIERGEMGGDCLNAGCVPSKSLIAAGERAHAMREAAAFGITAQEPQVDYTALRDHIREVIAGIAPTDSQERFEAMGVTVLRASARFVARDTVEAGDAIIKARRFVIATGARPAIPPIPGLTETPHHTNETIFDLTGKPGHLIVIGGGPIGLELAQAHGRLGARVSVVEAQDILAREDRELAEVVEAQLRREGVAFHPRAKVTAVSGEAGAIRLTLAGADGDSDGDLGDTVLEGTHLLVATGRKPVLDDLGLDAAGIRHDPSGINVDQGLRTSNRRVYAIGDCAGGATGGYRFTHAANQHAGLVIRSALFRLRVKLDNSIIPRVTYTDPELAAVGMSEDEARKVHKGRIRVLRFPVAENDRARAERREAGHVKVITNHKGLVLGATIAAPQAGELIALWTLALTKKMKVQDIAGVVMAYPTLSEISKRAAVEFLKPAARKPIVRRLIRFLRVFG